MIEETRMIAFRRLIPLAVALLVALGAAPASAADGSLSVTVRDNLGVIPDATVRVSGQDDARRAQTDPGGVASFDGLAPGNYAVRASFPGFEGAEEPVVTVAGGETTELELTLNVAQLSTSITVETPNRRAQLLLDVAEPTTLIDQAQIEDTGARSAKDVLVEQSGNGIQVNAGGGQGHLSINGIPNRGVLVLINGHRYLGKNAIGDLNMEELQLTGIGRIEVVKGAGSAIYGSDALGGVVNFITAPPLTESGTTNTLAMSGGSYSDFRADDSFAWRGERGGLSLAGGYRTFDGFDLDEENPQTIGQPPAKYWNFSGDADFELSPKVVARFFGYYQSRDVENYFFSGPTQEADTVYDSQRELAWYTLSPELDFLLSPQTSVNLTYNYGKHKREETRIFVVGGAIEPQDPWRETLQEIKLTGRHAWMAGGRVHPLQGGYEFRRESLSRGSLSVQDPERDINVLWAQQELNLGERLTVSAGVRYDSYSDFGSEWSPKAEAVFRVASEHRLRGSYGHGFRPPSFGELYLDLGAFFVGNPDLQPEISDGFTGGYTFAGARAQVSADYYYTKVKNGIDFSLPPDFPFSPGTYENIGRFTSQGVNLAASVSLPGSFTPSLSYTYNKREDEDGEEIGGFPNHAVFMKLLWANPRLGLRANIRGQILGEEPPAPDGTFTPAYNVWYLQVSKRFARVGAYAVNFYAQVDNLFDEKDVFRADAEGNPIPGVFQFWLPPRTFQVGITVDMDWTR